jgi:branched-chain amino acid transport system substrate-binding protein
MIRFTRPLALASSVAVLGLALAACGTTDDNSSSSSSSSCPDLTIAFLGPQTGPYANLGINITNGAAVALSEYNDTSPDCNVTVKNFDSQGDPEKATPLATQIINDDSIIGVLGPTFSGESDATGAAFNEAGLVTVSGSATNPDLTGNGWTTFHRILANDSVQAPAAAKYIKDTIGAKKVFVVDDASDYGAGIAEGVNTALGPLVVDTDTVQQKQTDFSATVTKVKSSDADTLFYGGYYPEAGLLVKQLRAGGWNGIFVSGDGSKDDGFVDSAGAQAAQDSRLTCPCAPAPDDFATRYKEVNSGAEPGTYSAEGYDVMNIFLQGIEAGNTDRAKMLDWVNSYDADGITKHIQFTSTGEVTEDLIYAYKVDNGKIVLDQPIK